MNYTEKLTIFYDENCDFCLRIMRYIERQESFLPLEFVPMGVKETKLKFPALLPYLERGRFVVLSESGEIYLDTRARLMIMYALKRYRSAALQLSAPELYWLADATFEQLSASRGILSRMFKSREPKSYPTC